MVNVLGIAIVIKAFLPTGKTLDEQFSALSIVKAAHETGDYAPLLAAANIDEVKTEQKVRRMDDVAPQPTEPQPEPPVDYMECGGAEVEPDAPEPEADPLDQPVAEVEPEAERKRRTAR